MSAGQEPKHQTKLSDLSLIAQHTLPLDTKLYVPTEEKIEIHKYREWLRTEFCLPTRLFFTWDEAEKVWIREHDGKPYQED